MEYVLITGALKSSNCVGILRFSCLGTMTSPTPKSILNGVRVFFILPLNVTPIPAYFFATAIGATSFISKVTKSLPVSTEMISFTTLFNCSGVFGILFNRKSTSTVILLSNSVKEYINNPPFSTRLSTYFDFSSLLKNSS